MTAVLLNHGLSCVTEALHLLRTGRRPGEFRLIAARPEHLLLAAPEADLSVQEPHRVSPEGYLSTVLSWCMQHEISLFWPQFWLKTMIARQAEFSQRGIRLILPCADNATLALLHDKDQVYQAIRGCLPPTALPDYLRVAGVAAFQAGVAALSPRHSRLCIKPVDGVYGSGFRILQAASHPLQRWLSNDTLHANPDEIAAWLNSASEASAFLLMEYLAGDERSIDCLARQGELIRAVVRRKASPAPWQLIEAHPESLELARILCRRFGLNGVINIQTRERILPDGRREPVLLEINPRMAGGIGMSSTALNLPLWAVRQALCSSEEPPSVRIGARVRLAETVAVAG